MATELEFYYILTAPFLMSDKIGISPASVPAVMTIAQVAEIFVDLGLVESVARPVCREFAHRQR